MHPNKIHSTEAARFIISNKPIFSHLKGNARVTRKRKTNPYLPSGCTLSHFIISIKGGAPPEKEHAIQSRYYLRKTDQNRIKILITLVKFFHLSWKLNFWYFLQPYFIGWEQGSYIKIYRRQYFSFDS